MTERAFVRLFDEAPTGMAIVGLDAHPVRVNRALCELLDGTERELLSRSFLEWSHPDDRTVAAELVWQLLQGEISRYRVEKRYVKGSGAIVRCAAKVSLLADEQGLPWLFIVQLEDVTAIRYAQGELARQAEELRAAVVAEESAKREFEALLDNVPDPIVIATASEVFYANPAMVRFVGYRDESEVRGLSGSSFVHPPDFPLFTAFYRALSAGEASAGSVQVRLRHRGGELVPLVLHVAREVTFRGRAAVLWIGRDLREQRRLEVAMMARDRAATVGTLAAGVAHEVNNPLASTIANLDLLFEALEGEGSTPSPETLRSLVADARRGAERVRGIVRGLHAFARGGGGEPGAIDLREALATALDLTASEVGRGTRVIRQFGPVPPVLANETQVLEVLVNLLVNAGHALALRGDATLTLRTYTDEAGRACASIEDNGPGIAPENMPRIFEPFFTTRPVGKGTGLGLCIAQGNVRAAGGELSCVSEPGRGARFVVALPASRTAAAPRATRPRTEPAAVRGRVLVVDDDVTVSAAIRRALTPAHEVVVTEGGAEALAVLATDANFDLVLCDLMMPVMTGMELFEVLRARHPELIPRVLFVTGGATVTEVQRFLAAVPNEVIEKPFDLHGLRESVRRAVARSRQAASTPS